jgi:serine/threonine protein kinase
MLGRYELITRIGQGGMAEVQLAIQRGPAGFEKLVVVKLVHENLASQKTFVDMLLDEARLAALVKHPNVVDIYDLGEADGRYFIAMEYLEGEPLLAVLRAGREGQRLDVHSTARLIADTAEGLEAAHALKSMGGDPIELVHHDISLGNIVVLYNGMVKLVDFGVAKATYTTSRTKVQGKFSYMAPEKLRGGSGDRRSDIFSLGCVLWESLTLKRLFKGGNDSETMKQVLEAEIMPPSQVNGDVPATYDAIVMRALERDADRRYATAQQLADDLEAVLADARYGRKNEPIARYMQETFKSHIDARKKLLQEVSSKGRASNEILEAAFSDPIGLASGSPVGGEFSIKFKRLSFTTPPSGLVAALPPTPAPVEELSMPPIDLPPIDDRGTPVGSAAEGRRGSIDEPPLRPSKPSISVPLRHDPEAIAIARTASRRAPSERTASRRAPSEPAAIYDRPPRNTPPTGMASQPAPRPPSLPPAPVKPRRTIYVVIGIVVVLAWIAIAAIVLMGRGG